MNPAVVDTNVVLAGLLTGNPTAPTVRLLDAMLAGRFTFVVSLALLSEYEQVMARPALARVHGLNAEEQERVLAALARHAVLLEPAPSAHQAPDPGDQHLWNLLDARPDLVLVTGDKRLFNAGWPADRVLSPAQFAAGLT
ncbi:putative toxin-antitoxin system toxin component, PIN family [Burkholderiales bacterium JOSHI_001]|nr:putative toxin-antitoxin system toxin component, PIN family [Burkholderiales bacterium JOSHI_001]